MASRINASSEADCWEAAVWAVIETLGRWRSNGFAGEDAPYAPT
jgi:hypothetical protein